MMTKKDPDISLTTTIQLKLLPTKEQRQLTDTTMDTYIATVNDIVADFRVMDKTDKRTSKDVAATLPSCLKNQCIKDAKSIFKKYKKACREADKWNKKTSGRTKDSDLSCLKKAGFHLEQPELYHRSRPNRIPGLPQWKIH